MRRMRRRSRRTRSVCGHSGSGGVQEDGITLRCDSEDGANAAHPADIVGDANIAARNGGASAAVAEGDDANLNERLVGGVHEEGAAGVLNTAVAFAAIVAGADVHSGVDFAVDLYGEGLESADTLRGGHDGDVDLIKLGLDIVGMKFTGTAVTDDASKFAGGWDGGVCVYGEKADVGRGGLGELDEGDVVAREIEVGVDVDGLEFERGAVGGGGACEGGCGGDGDEAMGGGEDPSGRDEGGATALGMEGDDVRADKVLGELAAYDACVSGVCGREFGGALGGGAED